MPTVSNLTQRAEFTKKYIKDMLKETGLCIYGVNNDTGELYLADREEVYNGNVQFAASIKIDSINDLF